MSLRGSNIHVLMPDMSGVLDPLSDHVDFGMFAIGTSSGVVEWSSGVKTSHGLLGFSVEKLFDTILFIL